MQEAAKVSVSPCAARRLDVLKNLRKSRDFRRRSDAMRMTCKGHRRHDFGSRPVLLARRKRNPDRLAFFGARFPLNDGLEILALKGIDCMSNAAAPATEGPDRGGASLHWRLLWSRHGRLGRARGLPPRRPSPWGKDLAPVVRAAGALGVRYLTIFSFSSENSSRPGVPRSALFGRLARFFVTTRILHRDGVVSVCSATARGWT